uniref:Immunoglobulin V-set domain-containing protein n=1 Tax=Knipowitschia caucasica TaxID=637954 RepID=A0AAV2KET3_KNICA
MCVKPVSLLRRKHHVSAVEVCRDSHRCLLHLCLHNLMQHSEMEETRDVRHDPMQLWKKGYKVYLKDNGHFPNIQILLKNLTREDTGVYWCMCGTHSAETGLNVPDGDGSVLLVVADPAAGADSSKASACGEDDTEVDNHLLLITVVISSVLVLVIFSALLLLAIRKVTVSHDGKKPRAIPRNDVYEEMRVSIRR